MDAAKSKAASYDVGIDEVPGASKSESDIKAISSEKSPSVDYEGAFVGKIYPTEEEMHTLPRVTGKVPWVAFTVAFVELCERFSYYGTTAVCMRPSLLSSLNS